MWGWFNPDSLPLIVISGSLFHFSFSFLTCKMRREEREKSSFYWSIRLFIVLCWEIYLLENRKHSGREESGARLPQSKIWLYLSSHVTSVSFINSLCQWCSSVQWQWKQKVMTYLQYLVIIKWVSIWKHLEPYLECGNRT